jgi:hypothetical protein
MRYSHLSDDALSQGLFETERAWDALVRYQTFLATGKGPPTEDATRGELVESNNKLAERLRRELDELRQEQLRRKGPGAAHATSFTSR